MKRMVGLALICSNVMIAQFINYDVVKEVRHPSGGVVVSAHPLASEAGASVLRKGGNAFDAAIAVQAALAVVYPQAGNIGGGGFMISAEKNGKTSALDFRETAPAAATRDMYLDKKGAANTDLSQNGGLAIGVPGTVAGLFEIHKLARLPMKDLLQPAIDLAEKGYAITASEASLLNEERAGFQRYANAANVFLKKPKWRARDLLIQPELAATLREIQQRGAAGFYEGTVAAKTVAEVKKQGGILSLTDLKTYKPVWRTPLEFDYKGNRVVTMPLPSSGGILLNQMLEMAELEKLETFQSNSPEALQIMIEAERRAFADRAEFMGDPSFVPDHTVKLTQPEYIRKRWESFTFEKATPSSAVGKIIKPTKESDQTTHLSILDREGNAVSITTTLNGYYGSKVFVAGAGFLLNNEMDDFSVKPGVPNMFGAVGGEANSIAPGKRMLSSMSPTVVLKGNKPIIVVGSPGGTTIPTTVFQTLVNLLDFHLSPSQAVNQPKFHQQWLPEYTSVEKDFPQSVLKTLEAKGYTFKSRGPIGRTELIVAQENGITAIADGRGDDSVARE